MPSEETLLERLAHLEAIILMLKLHICILYSAGHTCIDLEDVDEKREIKAAHNLVHEYAVKYLENGYTVETPEGIARRVEKAAKR